MPFIFEISREAAEINSTITKDNEGNLEELFKKYKNSIFHTGTEFRKTRIYE